MKLQEENQSESLEISELNALLNKLPVSKQSTADFVVQQPDQLSSLKSDETLRTFQIGCNPDLNFKYKINKRNNEVKLVE